MLHPHHKHSIKQTVLSIILLAVFGVGLFFALRANLHTEAAPIIENITGDVFLFPDTNSANDFSGLPQDYPSKPINKYLIQPDGLVSYVVSDVVDGNTILTEDGKRIRLIGIKAPDLDEEFGVQAADFLKDTIGSKTVFFQSDDKNPNDEFGRLRGIIYIDRKNVNIEILRNGFAHIYPTTPSIVGADDWKQFETEAMNAKRGLWGGKAK